MSTNKIIPLVELKPKTSLFNLLKSKFGKTSGTPPDNGYSSSNRTRSSRSSIESSEPNSSSGSRTSRSSSRSSLESMLNSSMMGSRSSSAEAIFLKDMARSSSSSSPSPSSNSKRQRPLTPDNMARLGMTPDQIKIVVERQKMFTPLATTTSTTSTNSTSTSPNSGKRTNLSSRLANKLAAAIKKGETFVGGYINKLSKKNLKKFKN